MKISTVWQRPQATERDVRWAVNRGYLCYAIAFIVLLIGAASTAVPTPDQIAPLMVALSATFGWIGSMLQIHAISWSVRTPRRTDE